MQLDKLTFKAQAALQEAQQLAHRYSHQEIDGEHLLLALVEQTDKGESKPGDTIKVEAKGDALLLDKRDHMVNLPGGEHWFVLSGYEPNDQKPLSIDGTYLRQHPDQPEVILLDFLTWAHNYEGKTLVLRSQAK